MQPRLAVKDLTWESQVVRECPKRFRIAVSRRGPERITGPLPAAFVV